MTPENFNMNTLPKEKPFTTPEGYFSNFAASLQEEISKIETQNTQPKTSKRISISWNSRFIASFAAIALFAFIIASTIINTTISSSKQPNKIAQSTITIDESNLNFEEMASEFNEDDLAEIIYSTLDY